MDEGAQKMEMSDLTAHTNALVQYGRDLERKLIASELLLSRYRASHAVALLFSEGRERNVVLTEFTKYLIQEMNFQKVLIVRIGKESEVITHKGFSEQEAGSLFIDKDKLRDALKPYMSEERMPENALFISVLDPGSVERVEFFGFAQYMIGRTHDGDDLLFIIAGYDSEKGALYANKYPLTQNDVSWFSQLVLLCGAFLVKMQLFSELEKKAAENLVLAEQREKQIEDRTRTLLDALFDAKKFRLVIERADMLVALLDSASHRFIFVNALWEQLTGYEREQVIGKKTLEFLQLIPLERQSKLFSPEFDAEISQQGAFHGSFVHRDKAGNERAFSLSLSRFEDDAGGMVYVVIGRDITEDRVRSARERSHVEEVEKLNQLMVNRELRIIELKKQLVSGTSV